MVYADLDPTKQAFIFELDNVIFPAKDYDLQVYYLFASFLEFQETFPPASDLVQFMKKVYENHGSDRIFDKAREVYAFPESYSENFKRLHKEAKLPLKLLMYQNVLTLLQEMVIDRKQIFIVTSGDPQQQLNKIKHIEWHSLEKFLKVYFADEINPKPNTDILHRLMQENDLKAADLLVIGAEATDEIFATSAGIDYLAVSNFI